MKNFISSILFFALTTLSISTKAGTVDMIQLGLNSLSAKTNTVFKQAKETNSKVRMDYPIQCVDFIESTDDGVLIQFTKGGCLSDDYILNEKIKDQDYFSGGLFHTSCEGVICKRTYRVDERPFDEIVEAHRVAENYSSSLSYRKSIINIAGDLYRKSYDQNKKITMKSDKFLGTEIPCSAEIVADAKEKTVEIIFPDVCPVPFYSGYTGNLKIKPMDLIDSLSAQSTTFGSLFTRKEGRFFKKEMCYSFVTKCQDRTCTMREQNMTCPAPADLVFY